MNLDPQMCRHPELVSGSMPQCSSRSSNIQFGTYCEAWMLKQVQHDEGASG
jgi:hypothetical protein